MKSVVVVPARLGSTRLPDKPLADIAGEPMIVHVWRRAMEAGVGPVVVAAAEPEIAAAVEKAGGTAVLTDPDLPSGSDRIQQAPQRFDPQRSYDAVVNLQGDIPTIEPGPIRAALDLLADPAVDIGTLAAEIVREDERGNPNVVKAVVPLAPVMDFVDQHPLDSLSLRVAPFRGDGERALRIPTAEGEIAVVYTARGGRHELSVSRGVSARIEVVGSEVAVTLAD